MVKVHVSFQMRPLKRRASRKLQPVSEKMRLEMVIRIQNEILDGQSSGLFSNGTFEKKPVMTIEDFVSFGILMAISSLIFSGTGCFVITSTKMVSQSRLGIEKSHLKRHELLFCWLLVV